MDQTGNTEESVIHSSMSREAKAAEAVKGAEGVKGAGILAKMARSPIKSLAITAGVAYGLYKLTHHLLGLDAPDAGTLPADAIPVPGQTESKPKGKASGSGGSPASTQSLLSDYATMMNSYIAHADSAQQSLVDAQDRYTSESSRIMQDSALGKIAESIISKPNYEEMEALMMNAAYKLPSNVYDQMIGPILKGYLAAKKNGLDVPTGDPQALAHLAEIGMKSDNSPVDFIVNMAFQKTGQEYEMKVKPLYEQLKTSREEMMKFQLGLIKDQIGWTRAIEVAHINAGAKVESAEILAKSKGGFTFAPDAGGDTLGNPSPPSVSGGE
jgi:hypothetical protein